MSDPQSTRRAGAVQGWVLAAAAWLATLPQTVMSRALIGTRRPRAALQAVGG